MSTILKLVESKRIKTGGPTMGFEGLNNRPALLSKIEKIASQLDSKLIQETISRLEPELAVSAFSAREVALEALRFASLRLLGDNIIPPELILRFWIVAKEQQEQYKCFCQDYLDGKEVILALRPDRLAIARRTAQNWVSQHFPTAIIEIWR